jgi:hypothetical protein
MLVPGVARLNSNPGLRKIHGPCVSAPPGTCVVLLASCSEAGKSKGKAGRPVGVVWFGAGHLAAKRQREVHVRARARDCKSRVTLSALPPSPMASSAPRGNGNGNCRAFSFWEAPSFLLLSRPDQYSCLLRIHGGHCELGKPL